MNDGKPVPGYLGNGLQDVRAMEQELQYLGSPPGPIHRLKLGNELVPGGPGFTFVARPFHEAQDQRLLGRFQFRKDAAEEKSAFGLRIEAVVVLCWCGKWDLCSQEQGSGQEDGGQKDHSTRVRYWGQKISHF